MADRLRFHLDEHIDPAIAAALRSHGIDVTTTTEAGLVTATDFQHLVRTLILMYEALEPHEAVDRVQFL